MRTRKTIVTHHAPDLDAIGSVWLLKRFDAQHYADARVLFVDPGKTLTEQEALENDVSLDSVTHVDTGLGEFDHHQPERNSRDICASSLVYAHVCEIHPELKNDSALEALVAFITEIDHFGEIYWPDAGNNRYVFMLPELIRGMEFTDPHDDDSQLAYGLKSLDYAYIIIEQRLQAEHIINERGKEIELREGKALLLETHNDDTLKVAQKKGFMIVVRKDPTTGVIRIKARPDSLYDLKPLADKIAEVDTGAYWFYHPSGKMLLNGSKKQYEQQPSSLTLDQVLVFIREIYGHA